MNRSGFCAYPDHNGVLMFRAKKKTDPERMDDSSSFAWIWRFIVACYFVAIIGLLIR